MINRVAKISGRTVALLAAGTLVMLPAVTLASAARQQRAPAISLSVSKAPSFTPASADPRLAAMFAGRETAFGTFKFTPAAAKSRPSQLRVAVHARATPTPRPAGSVAAAAVSNLAPAQYDLGLAVGWKRLAVKGDVGRTSSPDPVIGTRETAVVGVSYNLKKFTGRVAVGGERNDSRVAALSRPDSVSVDLGGSYNISRNIAVTGGVRYKIERDQIPALADNDRDSKAVYVGTAFKF